MAYSSIHNATNKRPKQLAPRRHRVSYTHTQVHGDAPGRTEGQVNHKDALFAPRSSHGHVPFMHHACPVAPLHHTAEISG